MGRVPVAERPVRHALLLCSGKPRLQQPGTGPDLGGAFRPELLQFSDRERPVPDAQQRRTARRRAGRDFRPAGGLFLLRTFGGGGRRSGLCRHALAAVVFGQRPQLSADRTAASSPPQRHGVQRPHAPLLSCGQTWLAPLQPGHDGGEIRACGVSRWASSTIS